MTTPRPFKDWTAIDFARASLLVLIVSWVPVMFTSLWLDELGTFWTISGSFTEVVDRAWLVQGQSPFSYVIFWVWNRVFSPSDFGLRVLPVFFGLGTIAAMFSVSRRLLGRNAAWMTVAVLVSLPEFRSVVVQLRPYSVGLFFLAISTRVLISWKEQPRVALAIAYSLALAATIWSVYYLGFSVLGHVAYVLIDAADRRRLLARRYALMVGAAAALCLPFVSQLVALADRSDSLLYLAPPTALDGVVALVPLGMAGAWLVVTLGGGWPAKADVDRASWHLIAWLTLAPTVILWGLSAFTSFAVFSLQYRSAALLGFALAASIWMGSYEKESQRIRAVVFVVFVGLLVSPTQFLEQNWRLGLAIADEAVPEDGLIVLSSGLVESRSIERLAQEDRFGFIASPLSRYPVRQQVVLAPMVPESTAYPYVLDQIERAGVDNLAIVALSGRPPGYEFFYRELELIGYRRDGVRRAGSVEVFVYRKP